MLKLAIPLIRGNSLFKWSMLKGMGVLQIGLTLGLLMLFCSSGQTASAAGIKDTVTFPDGTTYTFVEVAAPAKAALPWTGASGDIEATYGETFHIGEWKMYRNGTFINEIDGDFTRKTIEYENFDTYSFDTVSLWGGNNFRVYNTVADSRPLYPPDDLHYECKEPSIVNGETGSSFAGFGEATDCPGDEVMVYNPTPSNQNLDDQASDGIEIPKTSISAQEFHREVGVMDTAYNSIQSTYPIASNSQLTYANKVMPRNPIAIRVGVFVLGFLLSYTPKLTNYLCDRAGCSQELKDQWALVAQVAAVIGDTLMGAAAFTVVAESSAALVNYFRAQQELLLALREGLAETNAGVQHLLEEMANVRQVGVRVISGT